MPDLFSQHIKAFKTHFQANADNNGDEDTIEFESSGIDQAKMIMKPFMLGPLKKDVIKQLPAKREVIVKCEMNQSKRDSYNDIKLVLAKTLKVRKRQSLLIRAFIHILQIHNTNNLIAK